MNRENISPFVVFYTHIFYTYLAINIIELTIVVVVILCLCIFFAFTELSHIAFVCGLSYWHETPYKNSPDKQTQLFDALRFSALIVYSFIQKYV